MNFLKRSIAAVISGKTRPYFRWFGLSGVVRLLPLLTWLTFSASAHAQLTTGTTADGLIYAAIKSHVTVTGYSGTGGEVSIPSALNGLPVTAIGDRAFSEYAGVTKITIPSSAASIGDHAFYECWSLNSVVIPDGVISIGSLAFSYCGSLGSVTIPKSVASIGTYAFAACRSLTAIDVDALNPYYSSLDGVVFNKNQTTLVLCPAGKSASYTIPNSVSCIGEGAFWCCESLTSVTIPNSVKSIGMDAFGVCRKLTSVTIPNSVTIIGDYAFTVCNSLETAVFMGNAPAMGTCVFNAASGFGVYYFNGARGFTSAPWNGYPVVNLGPFSPVVAGNQMKLTYYAGNANVACVVQSSNDLKIWSTAGMTISGPDANNCCTATIPMIGSKSFMRLVVSY